MSTSIDALKGQLALQAGDRPQPQAMTISAGVESDRAIAMIQGQMTLAKRFPRDRSAILTAVLETCSLVPVAEDAHYSFKRGGSVVEGPSIDLLKVIAAEWGNIIWNVRELERRVGESTAVVYAIDLQSNAMAQREFIVRHIRDRNNDEGQAEGKALVTERDIYELIANMGSRRLRACLEDLIPPYIIGAARQRCYQTLKEAAEKTPLADRLRDLVPAFEKLGVTTGMLVKYLGGRPIGEMLEKEFIQLRNIYRSISTGAQRVEEFFEKATVADTVAAGKGSKGGAAAAEKKPAAEGAATDAGAGGGATTAQPGAAAATGAAAGGGQQQASGDGPLTKADLLKMVGEIKDVNSANAMGKIVKKQTHLPKAELDEIRRAVSNRVEALNAAAEQQQREPGQDDDAGDGAPE